MQIYKKTLFAVTKTVKQTEFIYDHTMKLLVKLVKT